MFKLKLICFFGLLFSCHSIFCQSESKEKMQKLNFLVGEWIGTSTIYEAGKVSKQVSAFEKISYDLDGSILVVELNTEILKLHTIIYYNDEKGNYSYNPFSEKGARSLPASFVDNKLVVHASETKRFTFEKVGKSGFREYGEELKEGTWEIYFEDVFINTQ